MTALPNPPERITIELTRQQYMALVSVLLDHRLRKDSTVEWINVLNDAPADDR